jgi:hypothetical protein
MQGECPFILQSKGAADYFPFQLGVQGMKVLFVADAESRRPQMLTLQAETAADELLLTRLVEGFWNRKVYLASDESCCEWEAEQ